MEKKYIEVFLYEKNIRHIKEFEAENGKKTKKICVSFPELGLCWLLKKQSVTFFPTKKDGNKSDKKQLKIVLSADYEYQFYFSKNEEPKILTGNDIRNFYKNLWSEGKVFVSTREVIRTLKNDKLANKAELNPNDQADEIEEELFSTKEIPTQK